MTDNEELEYKKSIWNLRNGIIIAFFTAAIGALFSAVSYLMTDDVVSTINDVERKTDEVASTISRVEEKTQVADSISETSRVEAEHEQDRTLIVSSERNRELTNEMGSQVRSISASLQKHAVCTERWVEHDRELEYVIRKEGNGYPPGEYRVPQSGEKVKTMAELIVRIVEAIERTRRNLILEKDARPMVKFTIHGEADGFDKEEEPYPARADDHFAFDCITSDSKDIMGTLERIISKDYNTNKDIACLRGYYFKDYVFQNAKVAWNTRYEGHEHNHKDKAGTWRRIIVRIGMIGWDKVLDDDVGFCPNAKR